MLGVGIRRALQPATVLASNGALLGENNMEMESQGAAARKVGWGQPSFQNTPPATLCYATAPGKQTGFDPLGLNMREAEIQHGRSATLATLFHSDPELKTKGSRMLASQRWRQRSHHSPHLLAASPRAQASRLASTMDAKALCLPSSSVSSS